MEIGDAVKADCKVEEVDSFFSVLKRTEMLTVNVEELNYLAKRLKASTPARPHSFRHGPQAGAVRVKGSHQPDLLQPAGYGHHRLFRPRAIGRDHYMNLHGGSASVDELNKLDSEETARRLIESGGGTITPYGVVYDNGMKLEQVYDGRFFPCYYYEPNAITLR